MAERRDDSKLALDPEEARGGRAHPSLERDTPASNTVVGKPYRAHGSAPELAHEPVARALVVLALRTASAGDANVGHANGRPVHSPSIVRRATAVTTYGGPGLESGP